MPGDFNVFLVMPTLVLIKQMSQEAKIHYGIFYETQIKAHTYACLSLSNECRTLRY